MMLQISYQDYGLRACQIIYYGHSGSRVSIAGVAVISCVFDVEVASGGVNE